MKDSKRLQVNPVGNPLTPSKLRGHVLSTGGSQESAGKLMVNTSFWIPLQPNGGIPYRIVHCGICKK